MKCDRYLNRITGREYRIAALILVALTLNAALKTAKVRPEAGLTQAPTVWTQLGPGNFAGADFNSGAVYSDGSGGAVYLGGTTGGGLLRGSDAAGPNGWERILDGDVGAVVVDPNDSRIIYASTPNLPGGTRLAIRKSTDGGQRFNLVRFGMIEESAILTPLSPLIIDPSDSRRLWTSGQHIWRTENRAANWSRANAETFLGACTAIAVSQTDGNRAITGTAEGYLMRTSIALTSDQSHQWQIARPRADRVSTIVFDPRDERITYAGYAGTGGPHLWRTADGGASWTGIDGTGQTGLPDSPVNAIAIDPEVPMRIYAGTDAGLFVSTGGGVDWSLETGIPAVPVRALVFHFQNGTRNLYAFTGGSGVWRAQTAANVCSYSLSAVERTVAAVGGPFSVDVGTSPGCQWTARSNAAWITVTAGANGSGGGLIRLSASANNSILGRVGTVTIAGRMLVVRQLPAVDTTPPAIAITGPTAEGTYRTDLETITLSGTASDDIAVDRITLTTDRGEIGTAVGTSSWTINVTVRLGVNVFTLTARDASGNSSSDVLTVILRPEFLKSAVAGRQMPPFSGEGGAAIDARLINPRHIAFDNAGNLYFTTNMVVQRITPGGTINTVIGTSAGFGGDGGPAGEAQLYFPEGLEIDGAGNIYIADKWNHRIRRVSPDGKIATIAGSGPNSTPTGGYGGDGGPAIQAQLNAPHGIALDAAGNLYIADEGNNRIRKVTPAGIITTVAGNGGTQNNGDGGPATSASVSIPRDVAIDAAGNLYIASAADRIRRVATNGVITTIAGGGNGYSGDGGPATNALLRLPVAVLPDNLGNIYISDSNNGRIRRISPDGTINTVATAGAPVGLALGKDGAIYIAENPGLGRISRLAVFPPPETIPPTIAITTPQTTTGLYTSLADFLTLEGTASDNQFLTHVAVTSDRGVTGVAEGTDSWRSTVILKTGMNNLTFRAWDIDGNSSEARLAVNYVKTLQVNAFAGLRGAAGFAGDSGPASGARFNTPSGIAFDTGGALLIADTGNHRIRKIDVNGQVSTIAGTGQVGLRLMDGPATEADLNQPRGVAVGPSGDIFFTDSQNHRVCRISMTGHLTTVAGTGIEGISGDGGPAKDARLSAPTGIAVNTAGDLFISDTGNRRIRRVDAQTGTITTVVDGAQGLQAPAGLAVDSAGNLYVADKINGGRVYRMTPAGNVSVFAGSGSPNTSPDRVPATQFALLLPNELSFDSAGNLYIIEELNQRVVRITTEGLAISILNINGLSFEEDETSPPFFSGRGSGIVLDPAGRIYVSDSANHRVGLIASGAFGQVVPVSAASFQGPGLSPASIGAAFGVDLATTVEQAVTQPLPLTLAGTTAVIRDSQKLQHPVQLFYVSPQQVNFLMPRSNISAGPATLAITNSRGEVSLGSFEVVTTAPALFSANGNGQGPAASVVLRVRLDGMLIYEPVVDFDAGQGAFVTRPIDLGPVGDQVFLVLFGTGLHASGGQVNAKVTVGDTDAELLFIGGQGQLAGLDQVNLRLAPALAGRGEVRVKLSINDRQANEVVVRIK